MSITGFTKEQSKTNMYTCTSRHKSIGLHLTNSQDDIKNQIFVEKQFNKFLKTCCLLNAHGCNGGKFRSRTKNHDQQWSCKILERICTFWTWICQLWLDWGGQHRVCWFPCSDFPSKPHNYITVNISSIGPKIEPCGIWFHKIDKM